MDLPIKYYFENIGKKFNLIYSNYNSRIIESNLFENIDSKILVGTNSGIVLAYKHIDIAVLGFNNTDNILYCINIQGGKGKYKYLTPIAWDKILLYKTIEYAKNKKIEKIQVPYSYEIEGVNSNHLSKLIKRYEINAIHHGFKKEKSTQKLELILS